MEKRRVWTGRTSVPGTIGQFIVSVQVPNDISTNGSATLTITVGNAASQSTATLSVMSAPDQSDDGSDLRRAKRGAGQASAASGPRP